MAKGDLTHFDQYREQTRVKHSILVKYLPAYFRVLKTWNNRLFYLDGFAGRGGYSNEDGAEEVPGSPIRALQLIAGHDDLCSRVRTGFIEPNAEYFAELQQRVTTFCDEHPELQKPDITHGHFAETLRGALDAADKAANGIVPTFMLVDPCGVDDVDLGIICDVLSRRGCEVFIFFNYAAVARIAGLLSTDRDTPSLRMIYGSDEAIDRLKSAIRGVEEATAREQIIVDMYMDALRRAGGADFVIPFRIEYEDRRSTSHFLIHATKNALGFKIMKHVMWEEGRTEEQEEGRLELRQASAGDLSSRMRTDLAELEKEILEHLRKSGATAVSVFRNDWVVRPTDYFSEGCYRRILLKLEEEQKIEVLDDDCKTPLPASQRKMTKSGRSLASRLFVRLS